MIIINKNKPFYIDKKNKVIRMGNFTGTGKEIEYDDESLLSIFNNVQKPISIKDLVKKIHFETGVSEEEIEDAIDYLMEEHFIIDYDKYQTLIHDEKYNRQNLFFSMFNDNYASYNKCFKGKNILILGLGGIGSNVAITLERAGFNNFTIVDCDVVEESNLIKQYPYNSEDIGKQKTRALKEKLKESQVKSKNLKIVNEDDIIEEIISSDFVLCTVDKPQRIIRRLINKMCVQNNKPVLFCGFSEYVAMIGPFIEPKTTACLSCIEKENSEIPINNVELVPSFGPLCLLISSIVSNEIINYFSKYKESNLIGQTLMFDLLTYQTNIINWEKNSKCKECGIDASK